jgi:hypothetical protein
MGSAAIAYAKNTSSESGYTHRLLRSVANARTSATVGVAHRSIDRIFRHDART